MLLGDADDAQDVAQQTFIRAYQALERFGGSRPIRPWLLRIPANLARNHLRALGRYRSALQRTRRAEPEPAGGPSMENLTTQRLEAQAPGQAVRRLSAADH